MPAKTGLNKIAFAMEANFGDLQKGHGISFADMDNDNDEDSYIEMGVAYTGDAYENSFYLNPCQNNKHWINILLEGITSNKIAIGAKIKIMFTCAEDGKEPGCRLLYFTGTGRARLFTG